MIFSIFKKQKHPNDHVCSYELRFHHKMHKDEWMWCCTDAPNCYGSEEWWRVWVLFGYRSNPFAKVPDYRLWAREAYWFEEIKCAIVGHNWTEWKPRLAYSFYRICRCCRRTQLEYGENIRK